MSKMNFLQICNLLFLVPAIIGTIRIRKAGLKMIPLLILLWIVPLKTILFSIVRFDVATETIADHEIAIVISILALTQYKNWGLFKNYPWLFYGFLYITCTNGLIEFSGLYLKADMMATYSGCWVAVVVASVFIFIHIDEPDRNLLKDPRFLFAGAMLFWSAFEAYYIIYKAVYHVIDGQQFLMVSSFVLLVTIILTLTSVLCISTTRRF